MKKKASRTGFGFGATVWLTLVVALWVSVFAGLSGAAEMREWQDRSGKFKVTASFKEVNADDEVVIELEDGAIRKVAFEKLSTRDQAYVSKMVPDAELTPVPSESGPGAKGPKRKSDVMAEEEEVTNDEKWEQWGWKVVAGGLLLLGIGSLVAVIDAFCESVGWGIASFLIPLFFLVYILAHRHRPWAARAGMLVFLGVALAVGTIFGLGQLNRVTDFVKAAAENPTDPFRAGDGEPFVIPD